MIIGTILAHRLNLYKYKEDAEVYEIREIIKNEVPALTDEYYAKKLKYQKGVAIFGLLIILLTGIPISTKSNTSAGIIIIVGFALTILFILLLLELKNHLRQFGEMVISYSLGCC